MRIPHYERLGKDKVILSLEDFEDMLDVIAFDEAKAAAVYDKTRGEESIPADVVMRLISGEESPLRVWREHRALTQADLAAKVGVSQATVAELESGRKKGSIETLKALATALNVDLEDIT